MNGSYKSQELKKWVILKALRELAQSMDEFTQYDVHALLEGWLGRPLTPAEKKSATLIARNVAEVKEMKRDPDTKVRIYIFIL